MRVEAVCIPKVVMENRMPESAKKIAENTYPDGVVNYASISRL